MKKSFFARETFWTVLLGTVGCFALLWNLIKDPAQWPDVIVNFAQIGVAVIVFFIANNIFKKLKGHKEDFNSIFEGYVKVLAEEKISVDFSRMEKTRQNAERLKDVVEYVKTIVLALA